MELFGNPTYRGVIFRCNLFRDIGPKVRPEAAVAGQAALRFDDVISGMQVYGNIFYRAAAGAFGAIQINSGRDNMIERNLFIECRECITGGWEESNSFWTQIRDGRPPADFHLNKLYLERYPELAGLLRRPALNYVWHNVALRCPGSWEVHPERAEPKAIVPPARARLDRWHFFGNRELADDDSLVRESDPPFSLKNAVETRRTRRAQRRNTDRSAPRPFTRQVSSSKAGFPHVPLCVLRAFRVSTAESRFSLDPARLAELGLGDLPVTEIGLYPDTRRATHP